jgi:periplasmic protein CpxP/Spy
MLRRAWLVVFASAMCASAAQAQLRSRRAPPRARAPLGQQGAPGQQNRQQLQRQLQQRLWQMTQRRVGLTDAQMNRLAPVHQRFEAQRRSLTREERQTRVALRDALRDSTHADQAQVGGYLDHLVQLQRQRADLVEQEQRELAQFMTPVQRARYTALQEQVRQRIQQLARQNRAAGGLDSGVTGRPRP